MNDNQSRRLSDEAARWRKTAQERRNALEEANQMLLGVYLRERLADPSDFHLFVGIESVTDRSGRIVWTRVDTLLDELLAMKPHLATRAETPWSRGTTAVDWFLSGTG